MDRRAKQTITKLEWIIIAIVVLLFCGLMAQIIGRTPQYFNAYPLAQDLWLLYTLAALGALPILYFTGLQSLISIKAINALKDDKPSNDASREEKAAYLKKTKPHTLRLLGVLFVGNLSSIAVAIGVLAINAHATGAGQETAGVIMSLREGSTSTGSNGSRRYFCRVEVRLSDGEALDMIRRRSFCRRGEVGDHLMFTRHEGALGLGFYRLDLPNA